jgi:PAS domain S-box-containing protein
MLAETVQDLISFHDIEGRFIYATPSSARLLGIEPQKLIGRSVYELVLPEDQQSLRDAHRDILGRNGKTPVTYRARRGDGTIGWFETTARVSDPTADGARHIISVTRDVTERRALEHRLMQSEKLEAIGRLAGGIAHDFNNLLTVIGGQAELALSQLSEGGDVAIELDGIRDAAARATALTTQLLTFGRRQMTRPTLLDLNSAILNLHPLIRRLTRSDIVLETELAEDLWSIELDPAQLEQILINLAVNARDAMPDGGTLRIVTSNLIAGNSDVVIPGIERADYVVLRVSDTGIGMDDETARRAFEPFFSSKSLAGGTGLGLPTVHGIVEQARGIVTLTSHEGHGTTASVYLRRTMRDNDPDVAAGAAARLALHGSETVLLVEDDPGVRGFSQAVLERYGYSVVPAATGPEALTLLNALNGDVDMLVSDIIMPRMRGPEIAARARERVPNLPVLFISGYAQDALNRVGINNADAMEVLSKPFRPDALASRVRSLLDRAPAAI